MKTSSVNFNTPSPMESKHRRFTMLRKIFPALAVETEEKRNRFEQTSRTLERKYRMRSTKDQLSLSVPSFLYVSDSPLVSMKKEKRDVPLRTAYSQAGRLWQPKPSSLRAQAQLMRTETVETFELVKVEPKLLREKSEQRTRK
ncbi:hypothetical protein TNCV_2006221, partial [Trichonephila clavipes]